MFIKKKEWLKLNERLNDIEYMYLSEKIQEKIDELSQKYNIMIYDHGFCNDIDIFTDLIHGDVNHYYKSGTIIGDFNPCVIKNKYEYIITGLERDVVKFLVDHKLLNFKGEGNNEPTK